MSTQQVVRHDRTISFPAFHPHPLLRGPHRQTVGSMYLARRPKLQHTVQRTIRLSDGDQLAIHDDQPTGWQPADPIALLVHGVSGCHGSIYMMRTAAKLTARGIRCFRLDMRGCGAGWNLATNTMHAGRGEDVWAAICFLNRLCPAAPLFAIGFSLGGAVLLRACSQLPRDARIAGAMAVAPPIDLLVCSSALRESRNRLYDRTIARWLYRYVKQRRGQNPNIAACDQGPPPRTIYDVDHRFTAPLGSFSSADDYYMRCSVAPLLAEITIPTLILVSQDDPLVPFSMFEEAQLSASTDLFVTQHGGHVGFVSRRGVDPDRWWLDWRIVDWVGQGT